MPLPIYTTPACVYVSYCVSGVFVIEANVVVWYTKEFVVMRTDITKAPMEREIGSGRSRVRGQAVMGGREEERKRGARG